MNGIGGSNSGINGSQFDVQKLFHLYNQTMIDTLTSSKMMTGIPHYQVIVGDTGLVVFILLDIIGIDHQQ